MCWGWHGGPQVILSAVSLWLLGLEENQTMELKLKKKKKVGCAFFRTQADSPPLIPVSRTAWNVA